MDYKPQPVSTDEIRLPEELLDLTESMAENVHEVWSAARMAEGWQYGQHRDDIRKLHPCLVPYAQLPDNEKEFDRKTAIETLKFIQKMGYSITKREDTTLHK